MSQIIEYRTAASQEELAGQVRSSRLQTGTGDSSQIYASHPDPSIISLNQASPWYVRPFFTCLANYDKVKTKLC